MKIETLPIWIPHCQSLRDRRAHMQKQLVSYGLSANWETDYDGVALTPDDLKDFGKGLQPSSLSLCIKHQRIFEHIVFSDAPYAMVLEDDALLCDDFVNQFNKLFDRHPPFDFVAIGTCMNIHPVTLQEGQHFYPPTCPRHATRCTHAYVISQFGAKMLSQTILPTALPIDHQMNEHLLLHELTSYWLEPSLVLQGSETGIWPSCVKR